MGNCTEFSKMSTNASLSLSPPIIFTRYLYLKDEVKLSMLISLLNKKESSVYWAFELYYSGFEEELFQHLWKIYYDFYYTLNPGFQEYFIKKYKEWSKKSSKDRERIVALIVGDLLIRPHNLDVFMLRQSIIYSKEEIPTHFESIAEVLETCNYLWIASFILERNPSTINNISMVRDIISYFSKKGIKIDEEKMTKRLKKSAGYLQIDTNIQLLAFVMQNFSQLYKIQMGKNLYISVEDHDIVIFETIFNNQTTNYRAYKILPLAYLYSIDEDNYLSLFQLERNKILMDNPTGLRNIYWYNWEYYASFSPVWFHRIEKYKGEYNHNEKKIEFREDEEIDWSEEFYSQFGYEPDEQRKEVQEKSIRDIHSQRNWIDFFAEHQKNSLYKPCDSLLAEFKFVIY